VGKGKYFLSKQRDSGAKVTNFRKGEEGRDSWESGRGRRKDAFLVRFVRNMEGETSCLLLFEEGKKGKKLTDRRRTSLQKHRFMRTTRKKNLEDLSYQVFRPREKGDRRCAGAFSGKKGGVIDGP